MHATVRKELIKKFENSIEEGECKIISNFTVTHNGGRFRTTSHPYKIQFAGTTSVRPSEELPPHIIGLKSVNFSDIHDGKLNPDFLIDVIDQIVDIRDVKILNVNKKQTKRLTIDVRLNCVLRGDYAEELEGVVQNCNEAIVTFVLRFEKLRLYQVCSLPNDSLSLSYTHPNQLTVFNTISVRDDYFLHSPRRTISDIISASEVSKCVTMCTIMSIDTEFGWYYMSHRSCGKKVLPHDMDAIKEKYPGRKFPKHLWKCEKCNEDVQDPDVLPLALSNIIRKTFLFKIAIQTSNIVFNSPAYKVIKIITQSDMVKEFSKFTASQNTPESKFAGRLLMPNDEKVPMLLLESDQGETTTLSKRKSNDNEEDSEHADEQSVAKKKYVRNEGKIAGIEEQMMKIIKIEKDHVKV
ncbi:unnamed protein product [Thlaspi arvense]|uniref:Replication protein A 70 kDa DNA-binding subunit B/D first OB fold domain-containing protein n=1 Tax=Thlaspi arvense TaxID=13288 RepID=A0AAU9SD96_THLAR|nr:unnamed protein product [Thlaspi arvense]